MSAVLSVRGLAKRFGDLRALREISFDVRGGEVLAVIGPNGAGKTTLLSIIAGAQRPSAGTVIGPPAELRVGNRVGTPVGTRIGWAPQKLALYGKLSVAENLMLFARLEKLDDPAQAVGRMLEQAGLGDRADERLERLSGGNRQRVNVAIGLIADPPVLALDEPSASLDPGQRERLWQFIAGRAQQGTSVVFSTHNIAEAQRYADRVIVLDEGELMFDDSPQALMRESPEAHGGDAERALVVFLQRRRDP